MPGFDRTRFVDISDQELSQFICGLCLNVFDKPMFTSSCCLQTYCKECITQWLDKYETCPNDKLTLTVEELRPPPIFVFTSLEVLKIKCDFFDMGCKTIVELKHLTQHTDNCTSNPIFTECKTCGLRRGLDGQHDCIQYMKVRAESFGEENKKLEKEVSELKFENRRLKHKILPRSISREETKIEIIDCEMNNKLRDFAVEIGKQAKHKFEDKMQMSEWIRSQFDKQWGNHWNCLVSESVDWATSLHYNPNYYIYFKVGTTHISVWKCT